MDIPSTNDRASRIEELARRLAEAGAANPGGLAEREVDEDAPVLARHLFLQGLWREIILPYRRNHWVAGKHEGPVSRMRERGVSEEDICRQSWPSTRYC